MTVSSTIYTVSYAGDGSSVTFPVTFPFLGNGSSSELTVVERVIATGVETTLSYTTNYTVTGGSGLTGTVTAVSAPAATVEWHLRRNTTTTQVSDYVTNDPFAADTVERNFDRLTMAGQERDGDLSQTFSFSDTYTGGASVVMPEPIASAYLQWNDAGDALVTSSTSAAQYLSGDGTELLPFYSHLADPDSGAYRVGANNLGWSVNGVKGLDLSTTGLIVTGTLAATTITGSGVLSVDDTTDTTSGTSGSVHTDGGLGVAKSLYVGTTAKIIGVTTHGGNIVSDTDSTDSLGTTGVRWAGIWTDNINGVTAPTAQYTSAEETKLSGIETSADITDATNVLAGLVGQEAVATGFTGTLDGILGSGTPAASTVTTLTTSGIVSVNDTTDSTSGTTGSIHTDGGLGVAKKLWANSVTATGLVSSATVTATGLITGGSLTLASGATVTAILDEDNMASNSPTASVTQQSLVSYIGTVVGGAAIWSDVDYKVFSDSPITVADADSGTMYAIDASSGAVVVNLNAISTLNLAGNWAVGFKKTDTSSNTVTINRGGTDTIDGGTSYVLNNQAEGVTLIPDTDATPDGWTSIASGPVFGSASVYQFSEAGTDAAASTTANGTFDDGTSTTLTIGQSPLSESNVHLLFDGVTQHHDTYTLSGAVITTSSAIPTGTSTVEIIVGETVAMGVPSDSTVTSAKLSGNLSLPGDLTVTSGSVSAPSISFTSDPDTGVYRITVNEFGIATGGALSTAFHGGGHRTVNGSVAFPSMSFSGDVDTGWYTPNANQVALALGGVQMCNFTGGQLRMLSGSATSPAYSFEVDRDTGFYYLGTGQFGVTLNGVQRAIFANPGIRVLSGSAGGPAFTFISDIDTGIYNGAVNETHFACAGGQAFAVTGGSVRGKDGSAALPGYTFLSDLNTGMYRVGADTIGFATAGILRATLDGSGDLAVTGDATVGSLNGGQLAGLRNRIINGNFDIWQRGTSFNPVNSGDYLADRYLISSVSVAADLTVSRQAHTVGQTDVADNPEFFLRIANTRTSTNGYFIHRVENVHLFAGQTVTLSFNAKGSGTGNLAAMNMQQNFGSGGSASVNTSLATASLTTSWQKFERTFTMPSISGKTVGTSSFLEFSFIIPASLTVDLSNVQFELGSVATPFEQRPVGMELALCQRYYQRSGIGAAGGWFSTAGAQIGFVFDITMRVTPTFVLLTATHTIADPGVANRNTTSGTASVAATGTAFGQVINFGGFTGATQGKAAIMITDQAIEFDAEL